MGEAIATRKRVKAEAVSGRISVDITIDVDNGKKKYSFRDVISPAEAANIIPKYIKSKYQDKFEEM